MRFMQDIESHTIIYLRSLLATRAIDDPDVATFLACWVYEETFHGLALQRFLEAAGTPVGERPLPRGQEPWAKRIEAAATAMVSKAWPGLLRGAHDLGRDQRADHAHRLSAAGRADRPPGARRSARAHRARRVATLLLLLPPGRDSACSAARSRGPRASWSTASGPRWAAASSPTPSCASWPAISSAEPEGRAAARKVDETIRRLPGFETVQLLEAWMDRHVGTPARRSSAPKRRTQWPPRPLSARRTSSPTGHYRAYTPAPLHARGARFGDDPLRRPALARRAHPAGGAGERRQQGAGPAGGHQGGPPHRPRGRRHRPVLPDQLHHRQPGQLPQEGSRRRPAPRT